MFYTINKNNQFVTNHPILKNISENLELGILQDYFKNIKLEYLLNNFRSPTRL